MKRVAVLGASGFIGSRVVEMLHTGQAAQVRPIVRSSSSLAKLSHFSLDARLADAFDQQALIAAFRDCDVVISAVAGSPDVISGTVPPVYAAAKATGVRRLVYLSSAAVHGQCPAEGTSEETPLSDRQSIPYNNAKVRAERTLQKLCKRGTIELVILRPGIVFGPRSFWVTSFADALLAGKAYLTNDGNGICNSIYVDNLVYAIELAIESNGVDGQAFLLGDAELVRWSAFYGFIAEALGYDLKNIPQAEAVFEPERQNTLQTLRKSRVVQASIGLCPVKLRRAVSAGLAVLGTSCDRSWQAKAKLDQQSTVEMSLLYACDYKLPHDKASRLLGYNPPVSFGEGCRRTVAWMAFAGYPVKHGTADSPTPQPTIDVSHP